MPNNYTIHYQIFVNCRKTPCTMLSIYHAKPFFRGSKFKSIEKPHFNGLTLPDLNDSQFHTDCTPNPALIKVVRVAPQCSYAVRPRHTTTCPTESNPTLPTVRLKLRYLAFFPHPHESWPSKRPIPVLRSEHPQSEVASFPGSTGCSEPADDTGSKSSKFKSWFFFWVEVNLKLELKVTFLN